MKAFLWRVVAALFFMLTVPVTSHADQANGTNYCVGVLSWNVHFIYKVTCDDGGEYKTTLGGLMMSDEVRQKITTPVDAQLKNRGFSKMESLEARGPQEVTIFKKSQKSTNLEPKKFCIVTALNGALEKCSNGIVWNSIVSGEPKKTNIQTLQENGFKKVTEFKIVYSIGGIKTLVFER